MLRLALWTTPLFWYFLSFIWWAMIGYRNQSLHVFDTISIQFFWVRRDSNSRHFNRKSSLLPSRPEIWPNHFIWVNIKPWLCSEPRGSAKQSLRFRVTSPWCRHRSWTTPSSWHNHLQISDHLSITTTILRSQFGVPRVVVVHKFDCIYYIQYLEKDILTRMASFKSKVIPKSYPSLHN